jgi:hypothetical protein
MKTAVEQLAIALYEGGYLKGNGDEIQEIVEMFKEMEKEQMWEYIKKNYCIGPKSLEFHRLEFENYYNETYGGDK